MRHVWIFGLLMYDVFPLVLGGWAMKQLWRRPLVSIPLALALLFFAGSLFEDMRFLLEHMH